MPAFKPLEPAHLNRGRQLNCRAEQLSGLNRPNDRRLPLASCSRATRPERVSLLAWVRGHGPSGMFGLQVCDVVPNVHKPPAPLCASMCFAEANQARKAHGGKCTTAAEGKHPRGKHGRPAQVNVATQAVSLGDPFATRTAQKSASIAQAGEAAKGPKRKWPDNVIPRWVSIWGGCSSLWW